MTPEMLDILDRLIGLYTDSAPPNGDTMSQVSDLPLARGVRVTLIAGRDPDKSGPVATLGPEAAESIVLSAHIDVVSVAGAGWTRTWSTCGTWRPTCWRLDVTCRQKGLNGRPRYGPDDSIEATARTAYPARDTQENDPAVGLATRLAETARLPKVAFGIGIFDAMGVPTVVRGPGCMASATSRMDTSKSRSLRPAKQCSPASR